MADSIELRMSVTSIKRVDPYVKEILATATHVALYKFNTTTNEWEKTETEGALFVYSRNGEPYHSIMVMNRLNTDNLIEPVVKELDYQMQVPFLLYRNSNSKIFGIWFFNKEECIKITYLIESLMEGLKEAPTEKAASNGNDILCMLSRAQQDFNKTPTKQDGFPPAFSSTPRIPDLTSKSVMDFFAKAGSKSGQKPSGENVLQRLMSNPANTLEHIEKQQRSITPQETVTLRQKTPSFSDRRSVPIQIPGSEKLISTLQSDADLSFLTRGAQNSPPKTKMSPSVAMFLQNSVPSNIEEPFNDSRIGAGSPFTGIDAQKPLLMTPMMFTTPNSLRNKSNNISNLATGVSDIKLKNDEDVDLLTEKQLAQALIHLLRTNTDFTKQIHEAYVSSIMEKVKPNRDSLI